MTMKFTMKKFHLVSKYANYLTWDEKQKFPESVEFVPHSHFFLKNCTKKCTKVARSLKSQKLSNDGWFFINLNYISDSGI